MNVGEESPQYDGKPTGEQTAHSIGLWVAVQTNIEEVKWVRYSLQRNKTIDGDDFDRDNNKR